MNENVNVAKLKVCINAWPRMVVTDNLTFLALASSDGWLGVDSVAEKLRGACAILPYNVNFIEILVTFFWDTLYLKNILASQVY